MNTSVENGLSGFKNVFLMERSRLGIFGIVERDIEVFVDDDNKDEGEEELLEF